MGKIFDTSTTEGKLQLIGFFLLSPFLILWSFLKWIGERLGIYKEPVYGMTAEEVALEEQQMQQQEEEKK